MEERRLARSSIEKDKKNEIGVKRSGDGVGESDPSVVGTRGAADKQNAERSSHRDGKNFGGPIDRTAHVETSRKDTCSQDPIVNGKPGEGWNLVTGKGRRGSALLKEGAALSKIQVRRSF
tara:strand:+ start:558 stop:917 length:360 start_codon:yes stop_codon:yes gene_type:complete